MILEVSQKQAYIFSGKRLAANAARSAEIQYVTSSAFFERTAGALYREEENLVNAGGGHTVLQFDGRERASAFARAVSGAVLRQFPAMELFVRQMPYLPEKTPGENLALLSEALEAKKERRAVAFRQPSFGVETLDPEFLRPVPLDQGGPPRIQLASAVRPPEGWTFPTKFEKLAGEDSFLAVVHIDGNGMGARVQRLCQRLGDGSWDACRAGLRRFSEGVQADFEQAFRDMAAAAARNCPEAKPDLPVRPVILAGDDVCFVAAGSIGLECARIFLQRLAERRNCEDGAPYAACAGVALVHWKYPFHRAYRLAEELCGNAKRFVAAATPAHPERLSAMDWHIAFDQLRDTQEALREDYAAEDGGRLELRPVSVAVPAGGPDTGIRSYGFFREMCRALQTQKETCSRVPFWKLASVLRQGEAETRFFLRGRDLGFAPDGTALAGEIFRQVDGVRRCLFFDAAEMMDHCVFFEEERT